MDPSKDFIKRIVGLPGDRVLIHDRHVFLNGVRLDEPYVAGDWRITGEWPASYLTPSGELVPPNSYFVLGDNRDHSSDSRQFGYINRDQIDGKALVRVWPLNKASLLDLRPTLAKEP
jgi:signal peptidase I